MIWYYCHMSAIGIYHMTTRLTDKMEAILLQFPYDITYFFVTHSPNFGANVVKL